MLKPRWVKVLRDVQLHKSRTALVIIAIIIGIVGAGSVLNTWSLIRKVTQDEFRDSNPPSATLRTDSIDAELLSRVRARPDVRFAAARRTVTGSMRSDDGSLTAQLFLVDDLRDIGISKVEPTTGVWPPVDGTIVLESSSVGFANKSVGDSMVIQVGSTPAQTLHVAGIARDVELAPGWMDHVVYGFVTRATLANLSAPTTFNQLQIVVRDGARDREAIRRIAYDVKAMLERSGHPVADVDVPVPGRHIHAPQINSLLYTQGAFGLLALLLSGFLVVNLVAAMLAGQVREIGVMKAIGATEVQIAGMYLVLALALGIVACAFALPIAALVGRDYAQFIAGMLNFSVDGVRIPAYSIALQLMVGALLPVVAALGPVIRGCRITVSEALRDLGISARGGGAGGRFLAGARGVSRPLLLSLRNAFRRRQRMALTLITLATGGAVYLGALNLRASVVDSVDLLFQPQQYDIMLRFARAWPTDSLADAVARVPGVARAESWSVGHAAVAHPDGLMGNTFPVIAPPANTEMLKPRLLLGRWMRPGDGHAIVVNTRLIEDEPTIALGAEVPLIIGGTMAKWRVIGIAESGLSSNAFAARETYAPMSDGGRVDRAAVVATVRGRESQLDLIQRLRSDLQRGGFALQTTQLAQATRASVEDHLLMVVSFLGLMAQLMIVVGGLGLAATMSLAVLERTREIGVLRAIGARPKSILTMIHVEGLVIALASWIIALPLSIPMGIILSKAFGQIMFAVPVRYAPTLSGIIQWLIVVLVVSVVSCALPAFRATRITTASALAYE